MLAYRVTSSGSAPTLQQIADPVPVRGQVRVRIAACGLNFADLLMIEGRYQERPRPPFTLGMEVAGVIDAVGPETPAPPVGTRVMVFGTTGGLAEYGCYPAASCIPLPDQVSFDAAAAFQIAYGTSHMALGHRAHLRPGETLLVSGAAGGVGLTAVEIGKQMGARVIALARGEAKLAVAHAAGADVLIDSESADLAAQLKALGGIDVAYETIGGEMFSACMKAMRPEGRLLVIGFAGGSVPQIPANHLLVKNLSVIGLYWGGYLSFRPDLLNQSLATLLGWLTEGRLKPHISHLLPLTQADQALALLKARKSTGKVVVRCDLSA